MLELMDAQATELRRIRSEMVALAEAMGRASQAGHNDRDGRWRARCATLKRHQAEVLRSLPQGGKDLPEGGSMLQIDDDMESKRPATG